MPRAWKFRVGSGLDGVRSGVLSKHLGPATLTRGLLHPWPKEVGLSPVCTVFGAPYSPGPLVSVTTRETSPALAPSKGSFENRKTLVPTKCWGCGVSEPCALSEDPLAQPSRTWQPHPPLSVAACRTPGLGVGCAQGPGFPLHPLLPTNPGVGGRGLQTTTRFFSVKHVGQSTCFGGRLGGSVSNKHLTLGLKS